MLIEFNFNLKLNPGHKPRTSNYDFAPTASEPLRVTRLLKTTLAFVLEKKHSEHMLY